MKNKKWLSALLVAVMVFTLIPMTAFATTGSGTEGDPYVVTTQTELFAAINESTGTTPVYIKIGDNITLSGASLRVQDTQNVVIDGNGKTITQDYYDVCVFGKAVIKNLTIEGYEFRFIIGNPSGSVNADVTLVDCDLLVENPYPSGNNSDRSVVWLNSSATQKPTARFTDCNITTTGSDAEAAGIVFSSNTVDAGGGSLVLDNTNITISENSKSGFCMYVYAPNADIDVTGGTLSHKTYYGVGFNSKSSTVDFNGTTINAWGALYFNAGSSNNTVNLNSGTVINSSNPHPSAGGYNNFGAIVYSGSGDTVNIKDGAEVKTTGTADGDKQFAAFFRNANTDNQLNVNGTLTLSGAPNNWYFGAVTAINSNLKEVVTIGDTANIDGFVLERESGANAEFYHAYTTLSAALTDAADGDTITLYKNSNESVEVAKPLTIIPNGYSANISASDGYVIIENTDGSQQVVEGYLVSVTVNYDECGTASANPNPAQFGDTVTLTATANKGYEFVEWEVVSGDIIINGNSFIMPEQNVEIKAIFKAEPDGGTVPGEDPTTPSEDPTSGSDTPQTGDSSNIFMWIALLAVSGVGITSLAVYRRKNSL